ncbi:uncharacterized protein LOC141845370 isoform X2 [Curcuma longa]|uniref:uncharacterized protein LOC141845370 isoform X2 n=1 Tax=Curcuma longa TaxID=136217 RepID=UPI003D9E01B4
MVGSGGSSSSRIRDEERFYCPPALRKQRELQKQQQQQLMLQQKKEAEPSSRSSSPAADVRVAEDRLGMDDALSKPSVSSSSSSPSLSPSPTPTPSPPLPPAPAGNLDRLLESTTPVVPARYFSKASGRRQSNGAKVGSQPYFCFSDLWESLKEWSAYGAGVPLVLNGSESVVQYYVPYLSAIQLYVDTSATKLRPGEGSSGGEDNRLKEGSSSWESTSQVGHERFANENGEVYPKPALPVFQYFEKDPPYGREPLTDKISVLASKFPDLKAYNSCDMLPSSWMSIAWYPIYRIPIGHTLKDLDACFLTFHSLAAPKNSANPPSVVLGSFGNMSVGNSDDRPAKLCLPVFGLASYKFRSSVWTSSSPREEQRASLLLQDADNWLRLLQVDHPDYRFFLSHSNTFRR